MLSRTAENAEEWQEVISGCFVPLSCVSFEDRFQGRVDHRRMDHRISHSVLRTGGTVVDRTERQAAHADTDDVHISRQISSSGLVTQSDRTVAVRPGTVTMYATDAPYRVDYSRTGQQQEIIQVSRAALGLPPAELRSALDTLTLRRSPMMALLFEVLSDRARDAAPSAAPEPADTVIDLAAAAIRSAVRGESVLPRADRGLLLSIQDHARRHLSAVELTIDALAANHFMSRRRLYELFARSEESPANWLRRERLAHALRLLQADQTPRATVSEVAERSGFADATTFSRAFHREYGLTPRDVRAGVRPEV